MQGSRTRDSSPGAASLRNEPIASIGFGVIVGLEPAIHYLRKMQYAKVMEPRVKRAFTPVFAGYARG